MDLNNCHESLDEELLELVEVCVCLQHLKVWAFLEINTVELLLQARLEKRTSLNTLKVHTHVHTHTNTRTSMMMRMMGRMMMVVVMMMTMMMIMVMMMMMMTMMTITTMWSR